VREGERDASSHGFEVSETKGVSRVRERERRQEMQAKAKNAI